MNGDGDPITTAPMVVTEATARYELDFERPGSRGKARP